MNAILKSFIFHSKEEASRVQCLLCGVRVSNLDVFNLHYRRNHTTYDDVRQCRLCGLFFGDRRSLFIHLRSRACPGTPLVYSTHDGCMHYRGVNSDGMISHPIIPHMKYNKYVGNGAAERFHVYVPASKPIIQYTPDQLPLSGLLACEYSERDFTPTAPNMPDGATVVVVRRAPRDRAELDSIYRRYVIADVDVVGERTPPPARVSKGNQTVCVRKSPKVEQSYKHMSNPNRFERRKIQRQASACVASSMSNPPTGKDIT